MQVAVKPEPHTQNQEVMHGEETERAAAAARAQVAADRLAQHSRELQLKLQTDAAAKEKAKADIAARKKVLEAEAAAATLAQEAERAAADAMAAHAVREAKAAELVERKAAEQAAKQVAEQKRTAEEEAAAKAATDGMLAKQAAVAELEALKKDAEDAAAAKLEAAQKVAEDAARKISDDAELANQEWEDKIAAEELINQKTDAKKAAEEPQASKPTAAATTSNEADRTKNASKMLTKEIEATRMGGKIAGKTSGGYNVQISVPTEILQVATEAQEKSTFETADMEMQEDHTETEILQVAMEAQEEATFETAEIEMQEDHTGAAADRSSPNDDSFDEKNGSLPKKKDLSNDKHDLLPHLDYTAQDATELSKLAASLCEEGNEIEAELLEDQANQHVSEITDMDKPIQSCTAQITMAAPVVVEEQMQAEQSESSEVKALRVAMEQFEKPSDWDTCIAIMERILESRRKGDDASADSITNGELFSQVSGFDMMKYGEIFHALDVDGSGSIDINEIRSGFEDAVHAKGLAPDFKDLEMIMDNLIHVGSTQVLQLPAFSVFLAVSEAHTQHSEK